MSVIRRDPASVCPDVPNTTKSYLRVTHSASLLASGSSCPALGTVLSAADTTSSGPHPCGRDHHSFALASAPSLASVVCLVRNMITGSPNEKRGSSGQRGSDLSQTSFNRNQRMLGNIHEISIRFHSSITTSQPAINMTKFKKTPHLDQGAWHAKSNPHSFPPSTW